MISKGEVKIEVLALVFSFLKKGLIFVNHIWPHSSTDTRLPTINRKVS